MLKLSNNSNFQTHGWHGEVTRETQIDVKLFLERRTAFVINIVCLINKALK